jgi:flagellar FliJ protein
MNKRLKRLQPLKELAGMRERSEASALGEAERRLGEAERRLGDLLRYRQEYERNFQQTASAGAAMRNLRDQQVFIARLGEAVRAQQLVVEQISGECVQARAQWREAATRKQVVGKVVDKAKAEANMKDEQRLQVESDERATQARVRS